MGDDCMKRTYELTNEEYRTLVHCLEYAEENAVLGDSQVAIRVLRDELSRQFENQDPKPIYE